MKLLLSLLLFLTSAIAFGQQQDMVSGSYSPGFLSSRNYVKNYSCFANTRDISTSGTGSIARTTSSPLDNGASCSISATAPAGKVIFALKPFNNSLKNRNCQAVFTYEGTGTNWKVYAERSGLAVNSPITLQSATTALPATVDFPCGDLSTVTTLVFESLTTPSPAIKVTEIYTGRNQNILDLPVVTRWQPYTPTFTGFGTVSGIEAQWRQVGQNHEYRIKFTTGTPTATEARISLANNAVSADTGTIPTISQAGSSAATSNSSTPATYIMPLIEPGVSYLTFGGKQSTQSQLNKMNGNDYLSTGNIVSFTASVPIANLAGNSSNYISQNSDTDWDTCTLGATQGFTFTSQEHQCKKDGGDLLIKGKFTPASSLASEFRLGLPTWKGNQLVSKGTSIIPSIQIAGFMQGGASSAGAFVIGSMYTVLIEPGVSYLSLATFGSGFGGLTKRNGSDLLSAGNVYAFQARIPIEGWSTNPYNVTSLAENMNVPGVVKPKEFWVSYGGTGSITSPTVCSSSPCTEYYDSAGSMTATRAATGNYSLVAAAGSCNPNSWFTCTINPTNGSNGFIVQIPTSNLATDSSGGFTYGSFGTQIVGGATADTRFNALCKCVGPQ